MPSSMVSRTIPRRSRRHIRRPRPARSSTCRTASRFCRPRPAGAFALTKRVKWIVDGTSLPDGTPLRMQFRAAAVQPTITCRDSSSATAAQLRGLAERFAANRFRGFPFVLHRQPHRRANRRRGHRKYPQRHDHIRQPHQLCLGRRRQTAVVRLADPERRPAPPNTSGATSRRSGRIIPSDSSGKPLPQPHLWAACLEYRDITGQPSSMAGCLLDGRDGLVRQRPR